MRVFSFKAAILFIALLFTELVFASEKDSLKRESELTIAFGTSMLLEGLFTTVGFCHSRNNLLFSLQYNHYHFYRDDPSNYNSFFTQTNSISAMFGYQFSIKKFDFPLSMGMCYGKGNFEQNGSFDNGYWVANYTYFINTNYFGPILSGGVKYNLTKSLKLGLSVTSIFNYYYKYLNPSYSSSDKKYDLTHLDNYFGIQLGLSFNLN